MHVQLWQMLLIIAYGFFINYDKNGTMIGTSQPVTAGLIVGLIMGDLKTGLYIGATLQLMTLGISSFGGASVPDYQQHDAGDERPKLRFGPDLGGQLIPFSIGGDPEAGRGAVLRYCGPLRGLRAGGCGQHRTGADLHLFGYGRENPQDKGERTLCAGGH